MLQHLDETAIRRVFDLASEGHERELTRFVSELTEPESIELLALLWHGKSAHLQRPFAEQLELSRIRHDTHNWTGIPEYVGEHWYEVRSLLHWGLKALQMETNESRFDEP